MEIGYSDSSNGSNSSKNVRVLSVAIPMLIAIVMCVSGCEVPQPITVPNSEFSPYCEQYATTKHHYAIVKVAPMLTAQSMSIIARDEVFRIVDRGNQMILFNQFDYWYQLAIGNEIGWVFGADLNRFCNEPF